MKDKGFGRSVTHDLGLSTAGCGSSNPKKYCNCEGCKELRRRAKSIHKCWFIKLLNKYKLR